MTKKQTLYKILSTYQGAEDIVRHLDKEFGICLYDSNVESFYHKYNYIIRKLFEQLYGDEKADLIESYVFDNNNMTFEELYYILENE